ncbi:MAG: OsmC family protein [Myxococcota bacterium]|nr:OsmC family protein [Myxococcota bacterium]
MKLLLHDTTDLEATEIDGAGHLHVEGDAGGEGFGPLQMLAASLALCTASVLVAYDEGVVHVGTAGLSVRVRWSYDEGRVARMQMAITWPELPENRVEPARRAAATCTVHRTLSHPTDVETTVSRS